jgi:hypothetical protein
MADIVNLRQARKAKAKQEKSAKASANRIQFGRTKAEKKLSAARKSLEERALQGHKIPKLPDES